MPQPQDNKLCFHKFVSGGRPLGGEVVGDRGQVIIIILPPWVEDDKTRGGGTECEPKHTIDNMQT